MAALRQELAKYQLLLQASEAKVAMWEECMQTFLHPVMLSPEMNDMYKDECSRILRSSLSTVEQIQAVRFVDCSFPSVLAEVHALPSSLASSWVSADKPLSSLVFSPCACSLSRTLPAPDAPAGQPTVTHDAGATHPADPMGELTGL